MEYRQNICFLQPSEPDEKGSVPCKRQYCKGLSFTGSEKGKHQKLQDQSLKRGIIGE